MTEMSILCDISRLKVTYLGFSHSLGVTDTELNKEGQYMIFSAYFNKVVF